MQSESKVHEISHRREIEYCPTCGAETSHEVTDQEHRVYCPEHGEVRIR